LIRQVDIGAGSGEDLATLFSAAAAALAVVLNHGPPENTGQYTRDATAKQSDSATFTATNGDENDSKTDADAAGATAMAVAIWRESVLRAGEALLEVIEHFVSNTESCRVRLRVCHTCFFLIRFLIYTYTWCSSSPFVFHISRHIGSCFVYLPVLK
jgi:hypothetical protein